MTVSSALIEVASLSKVYRLGTSEVHALRGVSLRIAEGEFVALMGPSGSGKSTLMHLLGCLDTPTSGTYTLEGRSVSRLSGRDRAGIRNSRIGFIFQSFNLLPALSAADNVALPLLYRRGTKSPRSRVEDVLGLVGLGDRAHHRPAELSGGERQRVAIARALVANPAIILADEPTGNLDSATGDDIMRVLGGLNEAGRTVLIVTHDAQIAGHARRVLHMRDGELVRGDSGDVSA